ncbi:hypothetical protein BT96DRAFT_841414, partial [Gymnopus androsaceus JB14]
LRIGRFANRSGLEVSAASTLGSNKLAFRSKVISRSHAKIWVWGFRQILYQGFEAFF